ncbi:MAG: peptidylprolyl isomerase [Prevotella sp.]|nr:peptidylprolyl isomerase [Prevotella sp.]
MKSRLLLVFMMLVPMMAQAADDPILFTVGDMPVTRSEFERSYLKNINTNQVSRQSVADYLESYIVYKLKVKTALDARIDATASFKEAYAQCLSEQETPVVSSGHTVPALDVYDEYEVLRRKAGYGGLICPAQIFIQVPQKASVNEQRQAQQRIESIYRELQQGADFAQLACQYSQDKASSSKGGEMGWYARGQMLKEIEDVVFALEKGEMSRPFLSTIGYHIFLMTDRKAVEGYDAVRDELSAEKAQRLIHQQVTTNRLSGEVIAQVSTMAETSQMPEDGLQREYYEGLLLYELSKQSVGRHAAEDEEALKYYFKKNKKKYRRNGFKPKDYTEVRELVVSDLQEEMDKHWIADLRSRYPVNVNKKVLKTVNNHR